MARSYSDVTSASRVTLSRFIIFGREAIHQAGKDWRARWRRAGLWLLAIIWIVGLILTLSLTSGLSGSQDYTYGSACQPDGSFAVDPSTYKYWSKSGFFQITLGFGNLSFTQAKAIDIIWDVFFGRGGQALLALISWRVFANYVTTSMEVTPVTFRTYRTIFLQNESLLVAIPRMIRDFTLRHGLHSKLAMVFMVITMAFILSFPTFGSAMTGYSGNVQAFVSAQDSQLVPFQDWYQSPTTNSFRMFANIRIYLCPRIVLIVPSPLVQFALSIIHDGDRIGKSVDYVVTSGAVVTDDPILERGDWEEYPNCVHYWGGYRCDELRNVSSYVAYYGFSGSNDTSSTFGNITLPSPNLNISAIYLPESLKIYHDIDETLFADKSKMTWIHSDTRYVLDEVKQHGSCQALLDYRWGFSYIQLVLMIIFLLVWSLGIFIMWLRSHVIMKKRSRQDVAGEFKAVFELADAMRSQLEDHGKEEGLEISALPEPTLRRRITKDLRGGTISYESSLLSAGEDGNGDSGWGFKPWVKKEKWWIAISILSLGGMIRATMSVYSEDAYNFTVLFGLPLEVLFAVYIGSTNRSRGIILLWLYMVLSVLPQIVASIVFGYYRSHGY